MELIQNCKCSITEGLCDDITQLYCDVSGERVELLLTDDYLKTNEKWRVIDETLKEELLVQIKKYLKYIDDLGLSPFPDNLDSKKFVQFDYLVVKTLTNSDYAHYGIVDYHKSRHGIFTFLWYLDSDCSTIFWNGHKVIGERGMFVIFPASWAFTHKHVANVITMNIITGTIFINQNKIVIMKVNKPQC